MLDVYQEQQERIVNELRVGSGHRDVGIPTIPFRSDYRTDSAICLTSVAFVPDDIAQDIQQTIIGPLKEMEPDHYYYSPDSMHITIKNVRAVHDPPLFTKADIGKVNRLFGELIPQHRSFFFSLEDVAAFTGSVSLIGYCDDRLRYLVLALDAGLNKIEVPDNKRYVSDTVFFGNVTLCRYVHQPSKRFFEAVEQMAHVYKGELHVKVIHLITCNLV